MHVDHLPVVGLVLHFRTPEKTLDCLQALQKEGIKHTVVVDNSEDGGKSLTAMQVSLSALECSGHAISLLQPGHNLGFAAGVACGLKYISGLAPAHVLLINSDARLESGSLAHMRSALASAEIVAPQIAQNNRPPSSSYAYYDRLLALITRTPKLNPIAHASGCCLLIHHNRIQKPLFDQAFFFYGEDVMLGAQCQQQGTPIIECPQALVAHSTSSSAKNGSFFYEYHISRAHWLLAKKLARNRTELALMLGARCLTLPLRALVRSLRFGSLVPCKGLTIATLDALRGRWRRFTPPP